MVTSKHLQDMELYKDCWLKWLAEVKRIKEATHKLNEQLYVARAEAKKYADKLDEAYGNWRAEPQDKA